MSLSGDKGVAQFKKSVKMGHPTCHTKIEHSWLFCLYVDQLGGGCFVDVVVCFFACCFCCWVGVGATRGTQLTYSQIRSV